jgi:hypothetical protein
VKSSSIRFGVRKLMESKRTGGSPVPTFSGRKTGNRATEGRQTAR